MRFDLPAQDVMTRDVVLDAEQAATVLTHVADREVADRAFAMGRAPR